MGKMGICCELHFSRADVLKLLISLIIDEGERVGRYGSCGKCIEHR